MWEWLEDCLEIVLLPLRKVWRVFQPVYEIDENNPVARGITVGCFLMVMAVLLFFAYSIYGR